MQLTFLYPIAGEMEDQIERLLLFFKRKGVDIFDDDGDDNSNSEYWEFLHPDEVEAWSIAFVPMTNFVHFEAKFRTTQDAMVVSVDEKVKDVVWYSENTILIHCETNGSPSYSFTICVDNLKSPFSTLYFLKSLSGSVYEPLMKEVEKISTRRHGRQKKACPLEPVLLPQK